MSKADKALQKILKVGGERNVTFDELTGVLGRKGLFMMVGRAATKCGGMRRASKITLPRHGNAIKPIHVKTARQLLEE